MQYSASILYIGSHVTRKHIIHLEKLVFNREDTLFNIPARVPRSTNLQLITIYYIDLVKSRILI